MVALKPFMTRLDSQRQPPWDSIIKFKGYCYARLISVNSNITKMITKRAIHGKQIRRDWSGHVGIRYLRIYQTETYYKVCWNTPISLFIWNLELKDSLFSHFQQMRGFVIFETLLVLVGWILRWRSYHCELQVMPPKCVCAKNKNIRESPKVNNCPISISMQ